MAEVEKQEIQQENQQDLQQSIQSKGESIVEKRNDPLAVLSSPEFIKGSVDFYTKGKGESIVENASDYSFINSTYFGETGLKTEEEVYKQKHHFVEKLFETIAPPDLVKIYRECKSGNLSGYPCEQVDLTDLFLIVDKFGKKISNQLGKKKEVNLSEFTPDEVIKKTPELVKEFSEAIEEKARKVKEFYQFRREAVLSNYRPVREEWEKALEENLKRLSDRYAEITGTQIIDRDLKLLFAEIRKAIVLKNIDFVPDDDLKIKIDIKKLSKEAQEVLKERFEALSQLDGYPKMEKGLFGKKYLVLDGSLLMPKREFGPDAFAEDMVVSVADYAKNCPLVKNAKTEEEKLKALKQVTDALLTFYQVGHTKNPDKIEFRLAKVGEKLKDRFTPVEKEVYDWLYKKSFSGLIEIKKQKLETLYNKDDLIRRLYEDKKFMEEAKNKTPYKFSESTLPFVPETTPNVDPKAVESEVEKIASKLKELHEKGDEEGIKKLIQSLRSGTPVDQAVYNASELATAETVPAIVRASSTKPVNAQNIKLPKFVSNVITTVSGLGSKVKNYTKNKILSLFGKKVESPASKPVENRTVKNNQKTALKIRR